MKASPHISSQSSSIATSSNHEKSPAQKLRFLHWVKMGLTFQAWAGLFYLSWRCAVTVQCVQWWCTGVKSAVQGGSYRCALLTVSCLETGAPARPAVTRHHCLSLLQCCPGPPGKMWGKTPLSCYVTVRTQHYVIYMTARPHIKMTNSQFERLRDSCLQKGDLYQDPDFPASQASVFYHQKPPFNFVWKRPKVS